MPESAIATGFVDFAIPVGEVGAKLVEFARSAQLTDPLATESAEKLAEQSVAQVKSEIYAFLRHRVGHDFSGYKTKTFLRRVQRRMQITQLSSAEAYVERLRQDAQEVGALFHDLLIPNAVSRSSSPNYSTERAICWPWCEAILHGFLVAAPTCGQRSHWRGRD